MTVNCLLRKEFDPRILPAKRPALSKAELEARRRRGRTPEQVEKERALTVPTWSPNVLEDSLKQGRSR